MNWGGGTVLSIPGGVSAQGFDRDGVPVGLHGDLGPRLAL